MSLKFTTASFIAFADKDTTAFHVHYLDIHTFPAAISSQIQLIPSSYLTHIPHSHFLWNSAHSSPLLYFDFLLLSPPVSHIPSVIAYLFQVCLAASLNVPAVSSHLLDATLANRQETTESSQLHLLLQLASKGTSGAKGEACMSSNPATMHSSQRSCCQEEIHPMLAYLPQADRVYQPVYSFEI